MPGARSRRIAARLALWNNRTKMIAIPVFVLSTLVMSPVDGSAPAGYRLPAEARVLGHQSANTQSSQAVPDKSTGAGDAYYLFLRGRQLEADGDIDGAIKLYQEAARLDPSSGEIPAELAGLYARQTRLREAIAAAESALKIAPDTVEAHWILGSIYAAYAQSEEPGRTAAGRQAETAYAAKASTHLEAVLNARGRTADPALLLTLGRLYLKMSAFDKAIAVLMRFNEREPDAMEGAALLADAYAQAGRTEDAIKLLAQAAEREPSFYQSLAELYERIGRWRDAADSYKKATEQGAGSREVTRRWALALLNSQRPGDPANARDLLQQIVTDNPNDVRAVYLLAQAQRQLNDYQAAEATARQLIALDPGGASGLYALAQVYEQQREYGKVVETLQPVVDRITAGDAASKGIDLTPLLVHLGFAYIDLNQPERAIAALQRAKQGAADNSTIDVGLVQAEITAGRYAQAADLAQKARDQHPDDSRLARLEADALRRSGQLDRGVSILRQAQQTHPDDASNYVALAELLMSGDRNEQAASVLQEARSKFPDDLSVLFDLGAVYERQKLYADAEKAFKEVLARDPLHAQALNYLGYMLADRGLRLQESVEYIRRALQVEPNNPAYLDSLGWAYFKMNRLDLAEPNLRQAATDRPRDSVVQDHWGDLLSKLGRRDEAIAAWKRALAGDGEDIDRAAIEAKVRSASKKAEK
jgi:tetratricopeptide (TPR) repeat protein